MIMTEKKKIKDFFGFFAPRYIALILILGVIVRVALLLHPLTEVAFNAKEWMKILFLGPVNDLAFAAIPLIPAALYSFTLNDSKYKKPWGYIIEGLLVALTLYLLCFNDIIEEYGGPAPRIANALMVVICLCFALKLFVPSVRKPWRKVTNILVIVTYCCLSLTVAAMELVFWSEFGVRFNFIAVDYLVYTHEVIGNIMESYPIFWMVLAVILAGIGVFKLMSRGKDVSEASSTSMKACGLYLVSILACAGLGGTFLHYGYRNLGSDNLYATQIQENGCWDFLEAFTSHELDYDQFYSLIEGNESDVTYNELCGMQNGVRSVTDSLVEIHKNIVLITIESLSADYFTAYGNDDNRTPALDALMDKSLVFDNLYATGNRTVRGLEAVTLCTPPTAGESIVKRPDNGGKFSTGSVLRSKGYSTTFIYGGDSYFDNMGAFFSGNGYDVFDKASYNKDKMLFSNIWGTCDEDSYREALNLFDTKSSEGQPFFAHIMTISNHRPYTYPDGRIEGNPMTRKAAVQYTDLAIGKFLNEAEQHEWFNNTVFVIVADHCASSAGKTSLPLECYHIPAMIYAPGFIEPARISKTCSQIDLMPTLFSLLHLSYDSEFCGQDILADDFKERAFMATYQDLGYYSDGILTILSPVRRVMQYSIEQHDGWEFTETLMEKENLRLIKEAQACYQFTNQKYQ